MKLASVGHAMRNVTQIGKASSRIWRAHVSVTLTAKPSNAVHAAHTKQKKSAPVEMNQYESTSPLLSLQATVDMHPQKQMCLQPC